MDLNLAKTSGSFLDRLFSSDLKLKNGEGHNPVGEWHCSNLFSNCCGASVLPGHQFMLLSQCSFLFGRVYLKPPAFKPTNLPSLPSYYVDALISWLADKIEAIKRKLSIPSLWTYTFSCLHPMFSTFGPFEQKLSLSRTRVSPLPGLWIPLFPSS